MKAKSAKTAMMLFATAMVLVGLVVLAGCKKESEPAPRTETKDVSAKIEQTTCPVMGNPINKDVYTEYQGKKVYFCCAACVDKFKANPEEYLAKLPQFKD